MVYGSDIKYFVKLQCEREFQKKLIDDGLLHMNCAMYFRNKYNGEMDADQHENELFQGSGFIVERYKPMFCLYSVTERDIDKDNKICLEKSFVKDFVNKDTNMVYITIIDAVKFEINFVSYCKKFNIPYAYASVAYGRYTKRMRKFIIENMLNVSLFTKRSKYKNQKEFRFVIYDDVRVDEYNLPQPVQINIGSMKNYSKTVVLEFKDKDIEIIVDNIGSNTWYFYDTNFDLQL